MEENYAEQCELAQNMNSNPYYKFNLGWSGFVSLTAFPVQIYFFWNKLVPLRFHGNIKTLLVVYFICSFIFSFEIAIGFIWRFIVSMVYDNCELLINITFFKYYHVFSLFLMTIPMLLPIGFSIERFYAMKDAEDYENRETKLGPQLVAILIGIDFLSIVLIFINEPFTGPFLSLVLVPTTSAAQFNAYFYFLLAVQIFNLISNLVLLDKHTRKHKRLTKDRSLSYKYQMEEINESSYFTLIVGFTHLIFAATYVICGILARNVGPDFFKNNVHYMIARASYCSVPTGNLVIVLVAILVLHIFDKKRKSRRTRALSIKSTGSEGIKHIHTEIYSTWYKPGRVLGMNQP